jgi:hypothetical protein
MNVSTQGRCPRFLLKMAERSLPSVLLRDLELFVKIATMQSV